MCNYLTYNCQRQVLILDWILTFNNIEIVPCILSSAKKKKKTHIQNIVGMMVWGWLNSFWLQCIPQSKREDNSTWAKMMKIFTFSKTIMSFLQLPKYTLASFRKDGLAHLTLPPPLPITTTKIVVVPKFMTLNFSQSMFVRMFYVLKTVTMLHCYFSGIYFLRHLRS